MNRSLFSLILRLLFRNILSLLRSDVSSHCSGKVTLPSRGWYQIIFQADAGPQSFKEELTFQGKQNITVPLTHNGISTSIIFAEDKTILSTDLAIIITAIRISPVEARLKLLRKFKESEQPKPLSSVIFGRADDYERWRPVESNQLIHVEGGSGCTQKQANLYKSEQIACLAIRVDENYSDLIKKLQATTHDFVFVDDGSVDLYSNCEEQLEKYLHSYNFISFDYSVSVEATSGYKAQYTPELNIPYLMCYDYIKGCYVVAKAVLLRALNALSSDGLYHSHELVLSIASENDIRSKRIPLLLGDCLYVNQKSMSLRKINNRVEKIIPNAIAQIKSKEVYKLTLSPPSNVKISIIIPAKDQLSYTKCCVESILNKTQGVDYEILLVNNNSVEKETLEWLGCIVSDPRVRVIDYPLPFNFSAINNYAVTQAKYDYLLFLNNDTEVISESWLNELVGWASVDNVGAVGCKLLYEDKRIQHAGVVIGIQNAAAHVHRLYLSENPGYMHRLECTQYFSAVTAAALAIRKSVFNRVGGFDEVKYKIAYNDVDLCLKCQKLGLNNVWIPDVSLFHYESKSRAYDLGIKRLSAYSKELDSLRKDWKISSFDDPYYNPNLTMSDEYFH